MRNIVTILEASFSIIELIKLEVSVLTEAAAATVEFFSKAIRVLPNGATDPLKAWEESRCWRTA